MSNVSTLVSQHGFMRRMLSALLALGITSTAVGQTLEPEKRRTLKKPNAEAVRPRVMEFAPRENRLLVGDEEGSVWSYGLREREERPKLLGKFGPLATFTFSTDGKQVAVVETDGKISVVDVRDGATENSFQANLSKPPLAVSFDSLGGGVAILGQEAGLLTWQKYRPRSEPLIRRLPLEPPVAMSDTGKQVVGKQRGQLVLWAVESQDILVRFKDSADPVAALAISPGHQFLAAATEPDFEKIIVWDMGSGHKYRTYSSPVSKVTKLRFLRREPLLSIVGPNGETVILNIQTGDFRTSLQARIARDSVQPMTAMAPEMDFAATVDGGEVEVSEFPREAMEALSEDEDEASEPYITVPVFYGTNRQPTTLDEMVWVNQFREFFTTTGAFVMYAICLLLPLVSALVFNLRRKSLLAVLAGSLLLLLASASIYATVRIRDIAERPGEFYGARTGPLQYGHCEVTVPKERELAELQSPPEFWVFRGDEEIEKHIILQRVEPYDGSDSFLTALREHTVDKGEDELLVYIHGYNTSFEDAARRAAQLAVDLQMTGPPVFFSWPSHRDSGRYTFDLSNAQASGPDLREFLTTLVRRSKAKKINVLAHSMGNVVLTDALQDLTAEFSEEERSIMREIILAAPDIDRRTFLREVAPAIAPNHHVTLYVSDRDLALQYSKRFHDTQRVGDARPEITVFANIDTIDASAVDTSTLGHSYYSEQVPVLNDLLHLLKSGVSPEERFLEPQGFGGHTYWKIVKTSN